MVTIHTPINTPATEAQSAGAKPAAEWYDEPEISL